VFSVLLVGADAHFLLDVRSAVAESGRFKVVGEAATPKAAADLARELQPDVIVADIGLPQLAGSDVMTRIRAEAAHVRIVISARSDLDASSEVDPPGSHGREIVRLLELVGEPLATAGPAVVIALPNHPASVARARRFVRSWCQAWNESAIVEPTLLVVSELVTNAITHGGGLDELRLRLMPDALRVEVVDAGVGSPEIAESHETDEGGRGLRIVTSLSRAWGVENGENGTKVIWSEVARATG
jgi:CheY-like chemotaxis protein